MTKLNVATSDDDYIIAGEHFIKRSDSIAALDFADLMKSAVLCPRNFQQVIERSEVHLCPFQVIRDLLAEENQESSSGSVECANKVTDATRLAFANAIKTTDSLRHSPRPGANLQWLAQHAMKE